MHPMLSRPHLFGLRGLEGATVEVGQAKKRETPEKPCSYEQQPGADLSPGPGEVLLGSQHAAKTA